MKQPTFSRWPAQLAGLLCIVSQSAFGDVIFNTFGPGDSFDRSLVSGTTWLFDSSGSSANYGFGSAARFQVAGGNYTLGSVTLALGRLLGTNNLMISIRHDSEGLPAAALLDTMVTNPTNLPASDLVVSYPSSLSPVMSADQYYWLVVEPADLDLLNPANNGAFDWYGSATLGSAGYREFDFARSSWLNWQGNANSYLPAFRIEGTLVPEPTSFWLLLGGLGWFALRCWRGEQQRPR